MIFDTHAHYTSHRFDDHRQTLLASLPTQGVAGVVECGVDLATSQQALELSRAWPWLYAAAGIHPESLIEEDTSTTMQFGGDWAAELRQIETLLADPRVVAIGECGLDHHWPVPEQAQLDMFEAHLKLAKEHDMPILIHDREAHAEVYELIRRYKPRGILHAYSGSAEDAAWITAQGLYLGIGGTVTFKNARRVVETVAAIPLERLVLETDCPYMAPEPHRGKENNSALLCHVAEKIAQIKGLPVETVLQTTEQTARALFGV